MATTPGSRRGYDADDPRSTLNPMQEPLGSMDRPVSATSDVNEVNLPPGETVRRTGNLDTANTPGTSSVSGDGRGFTATFAVAAVILLVAFLIAIYLGSNRTNVASNAPGTTQPPIADTTTGGTANDQTGSITKAPAPQTTAPGTGNAGGTTGTAGGTTAPANP